MTAFILAMLLAAGPPSVDASPAEAFAARVESVRASEPVRIESNLTLEVGVGAIVESIRSDASVYVFDGVSRGLLRSDGWTWRVLDDELLIEHAGDDSAYVRKSFVGSPLEQLRTLYVSVPDPYLALSLGGSDPSVIASMFHDGALALKPAMVEDEGRRLVLDGPDASMVLTMDESGRPVAATLDVSIVAGDARPLRQRWNWSWSYSSLERDDVEAAMRFERDGRQRVDNVRMLRSTTKPKPEASRGSALRAAPPLSLRDQSGETVRLSKLRGEVVVVEFWSSWCTPCIGAMSRLQHRVRQWESEGLPVRVLSVNTMERGDGGSATGAEQLRIVRNLREAEGIDADVLVDDGGKVARAWGVKRIPATFIVDPQGRIVKEFRGVEPVAIEQLDESVRQVVERSALSESGQ